LLEPQDQIEKLLSLDGWRRSLGDVLPVVIDPVLGAGTEQERLLETFGFQIAEPILVGPAAGGAGMVAAVPLVEDEAEGAPFALLEEQLPTELVVIFFLRADIKNDVGDRQHLKELLAVGEVIAVEVGRIDDDL